MSTIVPLKISFHSRIPNAEHRTPVVSAPCRFSDFRIPTSKFILPSTIYPLPYSEYRMPNTERRLSLPYAVFSDFVSPELVEGRIPTSKFILPSTLDHIPNALRRTPNTESRIPFFGQHRVSSIQHPVSSIEL
ncbi:hypothetical protein D1AOALGA4SA_2090 [Olavius algarvensis Delta 1 endosymbiont]|nr:hypothetical protein D1AOALGA4SA_2090 [Olavius algarvensis Delta 1 endosymbiont]